MAYLPERRRCKQMKMTDGAVTGRRAGFSELPYGRAYSRSYGESPCRSGNRITESDGSEIMSRI